MNTLTLLAASSVIILLLARFEASEGAQEPLVNCNEVLLQDRCACNERLDLALSQMKRIVADPTQFGSASEANTAIIIQQHQQHRLHTYYYRDSKTCGLEASPEFLPAPEQHRGGWLPLGDIEKSLRPLGTAEIPTKKIPEARKLLVGRWEGWQTFFDGKPRFLSLHVISVGNPLPLQEPENAPFVKACSDQGALFGKLRGGYVEFPRSDVFGGAYSVRLWRSIAPRSRDLEGVMLFEARPGQVVVAGLVSLARSLKFEWTTPPSNYWCQDRDLEEERKEVQEQENRFPLGPPKGDPL